MMSDIYAGLAPVRAMFAGLGFVGLMVFGYQRYKQTNQDDEDD